MVVNSKYIEQSTGKFLLKVKDSFLADDFISQMRLLLKDRKFISCLDTASFLDACGSESLFGSEKRILVLPEIEKDNLEVLADLVERPSDDILILCELTTPLKNKSYTRIKAACTEVNIKDPTENERTVWVRKWLTSYSLIFSDEIPGYIVSRCGSNLSGLKNEVKKIYIFLHDKKEKYVTKEICDNIVHASSESKFFVFMEHFFKKRVPDTLAELKKVDEYSYVRLVHFMIGQIDRIYKVAVYKEQGMTIDQIAEMLGVPVFIVKTKMFTVLSFYGKMKLLGLLDLLNKLDAELRTTKYPKESIFESYLVKAIRS